ncbi:hypothetical protein [Longimicrobium terrae]|uniref:Uncharacterized protein n=1 Tax=Longimicrobium terrae TaxID=1639882 RepID=A0A841GY10_9BACT|nr:hypothetical protein [Longimicrobium terrae]MBB4636233.1 hypothetical protein [Longimicrobium terrae]MBB6070628.1 hypothetical protein [Longimicrobium terrae]NNC29613.1 hypothetical protein [Longimicrobium terrae]
MIMILQQSPAPARNAQPHPTPGTTSPKPRSAAPAPLRAPGRPAGDPEKSATAQQPLLDRLIPAWQPARGVSQTAITLAAVLILMLLVAGITSLLRRAVFFFRTGEWKQPPPLIRGWKVGPDGASFELDKAGRLEDEHIRVLTERVDTIVSIVHVMNATLSRLDLEETESDSALAPQQ